MRRRMYLAVLLALSLFVAASCSDADDGGGDGAGTDGSDAQEAGDTGEFPREETLYITGTEWGSYDNWNPLQGGGQATGMLGLMYETLFLFDPHTAQLEPWLAESGEWTGDDTYEIKLRDGLTWTDGEALTAEDVAFTLDLRKIPEIPYSTMDDWVDKVEVVDDLTVKVTFSETRKGEWDNWLFDRPIIPEHTWGPKAEGGSQVLEEAGDDVVIGSGPYLFNSHTQERVVWERNDDWWGIDALGMEMQPRYLIDFRNASNEVVIAQLQQADLDLSNNFLPAEVLDDPNIEAYNDEPPYMVPWNVAYLIPNTTEPPLDDAAFRRAMAFAINVPDIVDTAYAGLVTASDPTGLLPTWVDAGMVDQGVTDEYGFSYDPDEATTLLDDAGYVDGDGDGYRDTPDGQPIDLTLIVPSGWTDWNLAAEIIAENLQAVGLNVVTDFPEAGTLDQMRTQGDYDLLLNNWTQLQNTPWFSYNYLYRLPIQDNQEASNFARYENPDAWDLTQQLGRLAVGDPDTQDEFDRIMGELQQISYEEMPSIPLWYNGAWAQWNTTYWTNWPKGPDGAYPVTWNNAWELGSIKMLAEIEPAG